MAPRVSTFRRDREWWVLLMWDDEHEEAGPFPDEISAELAGWRATR